MIITTINGGFQWIVALDQLQFGLTAAEQRGEEFGELGIDGVEGVQQALAPFLVERANGTAQLGNRLHQFVLFALHLVELLGNGSGFFVGAEVDGAQAFTVVAEDIVVTCAARTSPETTW